MIEKSGRAGERDKGIKDAIELQGGPPGRGLHFVDKEIIQHCGRILNLMPTK